MAKRNDGSYLRRDNNNIELTKTEDVFTAKLTQPTSADLLAADDTVEKVERLTRSLAKVTLKRKAGKETQLDAVMDKLRAKEGMVVHHEYAAKNNPQSVYHITDEIIIKFNADTSREQQQEILVSAGVIIKKHYPHLGACYLIDVTDAAKANPIKVANRLQALEAVEYAEPCLINRFAKMSLPLDEQFSSQWHLYSKEQNAPDIAVNADASVYEAWQITSGNRDIVVAVMDDGFELSHPDFQGTNKIVNPVDFTGNDDDPEPGAGDYHGTPCAGVCIAEHNDTGCVGVAPDCAFMPVRFPLNAADPWLIEIFQYVSQRANIASCSWGMAPGNYPLNTAVNETITQLTHSGGRDGKGLTIVFAAGNYDAPINATVDYPIRWLGRDEWGRSRVMEATGKIVNGYGAHPDVITVSACTSLNKKALYSNWGKEITVAAPSSNFDPTTYSKLPGRGITTTDNEYYGDDFTPGKRYTSSFGGTSSATPLVAGVCALVKSANPALTAAEIREILQQNTDKIEDQDMDTLYGVNKGDYHNGHSEWFGYGRVNAHRAVQDAISRLSDLQIIELENSTSIEIPDYTATGIASAIEITNTGTVSGIEVSLEIQHTWIGDLQVTLVSPSGVKVVLHDRSGGSADNISMTYTTTSTPALESMLNESAQGRWLLTVADLARSDTGALKRWSLKLKLGQSQTFTVSVDDSKAIPDNDPQGIISQLTIERQGRIRNIIVSLDITHSWIGDLQVSLVAPSHREIALHEGGGGSADNIRKRYTIQDIDGLAELVQANENCHGTWTLKVADVAQRDVGKLNQWGLEITLV